MAYRVIRDYYRQEHFDFFRPYASPFWAVSFELDVTRTLEFLRARRLPTYLNLCYLLTRACQPLEDFRYRLLGGEIVLHDAIHPGLTVPAEGGRFHFAHYDYLPDLDAFNRAAAERDARHPASELAEWDGPERAWIYFSALPKVAFTGLTHAVPDAGDDQVRVSFGRFVERGGTTRVPVGLQVNHVFVDGGAVGELAERARAAYDQPE